MASLSDNLNARQVEAVLHKDGPMLVLAGAGSGKTTVLIARVERLIESGVRPWNILTITFTNKAADELKNRLVAKLGTEAADVFASTFHSMCVRILRRDGEKIGIPKSFTIYDADDSLRVVKKCLKTRRAPWILTICSAKRCGFSAKVRKPWNTTRTAGDT